MDELQQLRDRHDALPDPAPQSIAEARGRLATRMHQSPARNRSWTRSARRVQGA
ncbi:hypothetical protein [Nonomuraea dietziae]|uniref:hypothetical protein n=1 Tax=Nonomuraea dietziae TaxID=65515 RepID=UPI003405BBFF